MVARNRILPAQHSTRSSRGDDSDGVIVVVEEDDDMVPGAHTVPGQNDRMGSRSTVVSGGGSAGAALVVDLYLWRALLRRW